MCSNRVEAVLRRLLLRAASLVLAEVRLEVLQARLLVLLRVRRIMLLLRKNWRLVGSLRVLFWRLLCCCRHDGGLHGLGIKGQMVHMLDLYH